MALETNEDSSYDSDFEPDEPCASRGEGSDRHGDVSRTASDTLGAEFAEYVDADSSTGIVGSVGSVGGVGSAGCVEFGLKLGYSERLIRTALQKLGPDPSQNELLGELVRLGAQTPRRPDSPSSGPEDAPVPSPPARDRLRPIVVDGSNVAMSHGNKEFFSCRGIKICVDWFVSRGHREITVFVPMWRKEASRPDHPITEQEILFELERDRRLVFTPSRLVGGKRYVCYDDRYVLRLAAEKDGIVVSNDNYRDLVQESSEFRKIVEERILMYTFVNDVFMPPDDPLGRAGPTLDAFLRVPRRTEPSSRCPYGKKCTYGNKCKFHHPERGNVPQKSVADRLTEHAQRQLQARGLPREDLKTHSLPLCDPAPVARKTPLARTKSAVPQSVGPFVPPAGIESSDRRVDPPAKSRSIENIATGMRELGFVSAPFVHSLTRNVRPTPWKYAPSAPSTPSTPLAPSASSADADEPRNPHRKLQRQLTINPSHDPRLYNIHGCNLNVAPPTPGERWTEHQAVSRIASAPAAYPTLASESRMHAMQPQLQPQWAWPPSQLALQDPRARLHYHLANIFPEEQVRQAMIQFPEETNPQNICAAILNMFHKT